MFLLAGVLLGGCAGTPAARPTLRYTFDTATNTCRQHPGQCAKVPGEPPVLPLSGPAQVAASAGMTGQVVVKALEAQERAVIDAALKECAEQARAEVLVRRLEGRSPTQAECNEVVARDAGGQPVTRAMRLGTEMHQEALKCTEAALKKLRPGRFSLEELYRYNRETREVTRVSPEERKALLRQGRGGELLGALAPDLILHAGNPLHIQAVYDFKFPCVNSSQRAPWRSYPKGHPYDGLSQGSMYNEVFGVSPLRVSPHLGVY